MRRGNTKKTDAILMLARAALADRRRRSPVTILLTLVILLIILTPVVWFFWPRPELPPLLLAAYDQVALPDEPVAVCARVEPQDADLSTAYLSGCDLYFQEVKSGQLVGKVLTRNDGSASVEKSFAASDLPAEVDVRYPGEKDRRRGLEAKARVFVWPADTPLLLVDADHALADVEEAKRWTTNNLDIRPRPGAAAALAKARVKYHVIYLTFAAARPSRYTRLRAWIERVAPAQERFPDGPVIAALWNAPDPDAADVQRAALAELKRRFHGPAAAITRRADTAKLLHQAGWQTFLLGEAGEVGEDITVLKGWSELASHLSK